MADSCKPKSARKTAVWKLRREYVSATNATSLKLTDKINNSKETKVNVRPAKTLSVSAAKTADGQRTVAVRAANVRAIKTDDKSNQVSGMQAAVEHAVIQDQKPPQKLSNTTEAANETRQFVNSPTTAPVENGKAIVKTTDLKTGTPKNAVVKATRPSIIKKTVLKDGVSISPTASATTVGAHLEILFRT